MSSARALLRYRNPDSTQDINDRLAGLYAKGIFSGGLVTPVSGVLRITLDGFATVGSDGMVVRETNTTELDVEAGVKNYVVIRQEYQINSDPTVIVEVLPQDLFEATGPAGQQGAANPFMLVFATVDIPLGETQVSSAQIQYQEADRIDVSGRSQFRGLVDDEASLPAAGLNFNRVGDYYIVTDGTGDQPQFWCWNGVAWANVTETTNIQEELDRHRGNLNDNGAELHITQPQADALSGAGVEDPSVTNRYVLEDYALLPDADQSAALQGNGLPLEDELPSATNRFVTSTKVVATPKESGPKPSGETGTNVLYIELSLTDNDSFFVGTGAQGTAAKWFSLYADTEGSFEYVNSSFAPVTIIGVQTGDPGGEPDGFEINPAGDGRVDDLGFFIPDVGSGGSLFLIVNWPVPAPGAMVSYGSRTHWGDFLPEFMIQRGPQSPQTDTNMTRLLLGTANAQFFDDAIWNAGVGQVVAWNAGLARFVPADPDNMLPPVGIRGMYNNLIQEGMFTQVGSFTPGLVYADKANPGSLTNIENEWFIGTALSTDTLLVNMNGIPLQASAEVTPGVSFPPSLFGGLVQEGQTVAFDPNTNLFQRADINDPDLHPTGFVGTNFNIIASGLYVPSSGAPFVTGNKYYASTAPGILTTAPNDWYIGVAVSDSQFLVNMASVAIPRQWEVEHDSDSGRHAFESGGAGSRPVDPVTGTIFLRTDLTPPRIEYWDGATWANATSEASVPEGSRMLFANHTIPAGWTLDASVHDAVIRVVNNAGPPDAAGPTLGNLASGTWVISGVSDNPLSLDADQIPVHYHFLLGASGDGGMETLNDRGPIGANDGGGSGGTNPFSAEASGVRENYGTNNATPSDNDPHQHGITSDGTWRPYNLTVILCQRDPS